MHHAGYLCRVRSDVPVHRRPLPTAHCHVGLFDSTRCGPTTARDIYLLRVWQAAIQCVHPGSRRHCCGSTTCYHRLLPQRALPVHAHGPARVTTMLAGATAFAAPPHGGLGIRSRSRSVAVHAAKRGAAKKKTKDPRKAKGRRTTTVEAPTSHVQDLLQEYRSVAGSSSLSQQQQHLGSPDHTPGHLPPTSQDQGAISQLLDHTISTLLTQAVSDTRVTSSSPSVAVASHAASPMLANGSSGEGASTPMSAAGHAGTDQAAARTSQKSAAAAAPEPHAASQPKAASGSTQDGTGAAAAAAAATSQEAVAASADAASPLGDSSSSRRQPPRAERPAPATVPDAVQQLLSLPQLTPSSLASGFTPVGDAPAVAAKGGKGKNSSSSSGGSGSATAASTATAGAVPPPVTQTAKEAIVKAATTPSSSKGPGATEAAQPAASAAADKGAAPAAAAAADGDKKAAAGDKKQTAAKAATKDDSKPAAATKSSSGGSGCGDSAADRSATAAALATLLLPRLTNAATDLGEVEGHVGRLTRLMNEASGTLTSLKDFSSTTEVPLLNIMSDVLGDITQEMDLVQLQLRAARAGLDATYTHVSTAAAGGQVEASPAARAAAAGGAGGGDTTQLLAQLSLKSQQAAAAEAQVEALRSQLALALQPSLQREAPEGEGGQDLVKQQVVTNLALLGQLEALTRTILSKEASLVSGRDSPDDAPAAAAAVVEAVGDMVKLVGEAGMGLTATVRQLQEANEAAAKVAKAAGGEGGGSSSAFGLSIDDLKAAAQNKKQEKVV